MIDRSNDVVSKKEDYRIIARGDDFGKVSIMRYPYIVDKSEYNEYRGHSSHVTNVKFSPHDKYLYSAGGED